MSGRAVGVASVSDRHLAFVVCEWLSQVSARSGDEDLSESLGVALEVIQSSFDTDLDDAAQRQDWSLTARSSDLPTVFGLGNSGREQIEQALSQLKEKSGTTSAPGAAAAPPVNETEGKWSAYLALITGRGYFGATKPGSKQYEERYARARSKFLEKHAPADDAAPSEDPASSVSAPASAGLGDDEMPALAGASPEDHARAEEKKLAGNKALQGGQFDEAIELYSEAIELDDSVAIYFSNRAAAFSHQNQHDKAIADCDEALSRDPRYGKAYSRKGLAHFSLGQYSEAAKAYERALELEPGNDAVKKSLAAARAKLPAAAGAPAGAPAGMEDMLNQARANPDVAQMMADMQAGGGPPDIGSMMNNPAVAQMAQQAMQNPQMMEMAQQMMSDPAAMQRMMGMFGGGT